LEHLHLQKEKKRVPEGRNGNIIDLSKTYQVSSLSPITTDHAGMFPPHPRGRKGRIKRGRVQTLAGKWQSFFLIFYLFIFFWTEFSSALPDPSSTPRLKYAKINKYSSNLMSLDDIVRIWTQLGFTQGMLIAIASSDASRPRIAWIGTQLFLVIVMIWPQKKRRPCYFNLTSTAQQSFTVSYAKEHKKDLRLQIWVLDRPTALLDEDQLMISGQKCPKVWSFELRCSRILISNSYFTASQNGKTRQTDESWCSRRFPCHSVKLILLANGNRYGRYEVVTGLVMQIPFCIRTIWQTNRIASIALPHFRMFIANSIFAFLFCLPVLN
jgi:hypothetical protein